MRVTLLKFERDTDFLEIFTDRTEVSVDGKIYDTKEDFYKPKGNMLRSIIIMDPKLRAFGFDTKVLDMELLDKGGRKGITKKIVLTKILNHRKETVRDDAETYYNHIIAILKFLEEFNEGKRQAKLLNLDKETADTWGDIIGNL